MSDRLDFERKTRAWLDITPREAPDRLVMDVLEALATVPQVRPSPIRRWVDRLTARPARLDRRAVAILASFALVLVVAGSAVLPGRLPAVGGPSSGPSPRASAANRTLMDLRRTWLADVAPIPKLGSYRSRLRLEIGTEPESLVLRDAPGAAPIMDATFHSQGLDLLRLVAPTDGGGCARGDQGDYRWSLGNGGATLMLTMVSDPCATRAAVLGRNWTASVSDDGPGGAGVVDVFDPMFAVTLPKIDFVARRSTDAIEMGAADGSLTMLAFKDPQGFKDPCLGDGGGRSVIAPGADAFVAYFRSLPGFTIASTAEVVVDGHRAVHLVVDSDPAARCPAGYLLEWQPRAETTTSWHLEPGRRDPMTIVELPDSTILFQFLGPSGQDVGAGMIRTVRFIARLPTLP